jgi:hypothetical protein
MLRPMQGEACQELYSKSCRISDFSNEWYSRNLYIIPGTFYVCGAKILY